MQKRVKVRLGQSVCLNYHDSVGGGNETNNASKLLHCKVSFLYLIIESNLITTYNFIPSILAKVIIFQLEVMYESITEQHSQHSPMTYFGVQGDY